jgi:hypothetical protein
VYAFNSQGVLVEKNSVLNVQGPRPRGNMAQFNAVSGAGNAIRCNVNENRAGESYTEDIVNLWQTHGTEAAPILVVGNRIRGGGPSTSGGGILLGDGGGSWQLSSDNILVDPGQYGNSIAGGDHMTIRNNTIFARQQPFTNIGSYMYNYYASACTANTVTGNLIHFINSKGQRNDIWNGGNCTSSAFTNNNTTVTLTADVINNVPAPCR